MPHLCCNCPASFTLRRRWLRSPTQVTYLCKPPGMCSFAVLPQREIFRTKLFHITSHLYKAT
ncbi:hypothetical protein CBJ83_15625 [Salmonella enterica subsp. enterica serovar Give]|nr:hypothetical protein [Salmonella enterica subsp. enterica serovar Give]